MIAVWILLGVVGTFLAVIVGRTFAFSPPPDPPVTIRAVTIDEGAVATRMRALIRCRTVSRGTKSREEEAAFAVIPALLRQLYPRLHAVCRQELVGKRGILYHWPGRSSDRPSVIVAHYDVAPAEAGRWTKPPFDGVLQDGVLWGRGALGAKGTLLGIFEAAEMLIGQGYVPKNDLYLSLGGDEETEGTGARDIAEVLKRRGIAPVFVLDRGGAVVRGEFPGLKRPCALVGVAEKGAVNVTLRAAQGGTAAPAGRSQLSTDVLAQAKKRVEKTSFPLRLTPPAQALFETLGKHCMFPARLFFANLWCFLPLLELLCRKRGGELNTLIRTTCAFAGSVAAGEQAACAAVGAQVRIVGGETAEHVKARLTAVIRDDRVTVEAKAHKAPSPVSRTDGEPWLRLQKAIAQTWPEAVLSPYPMGVTSDAYHYAGLSDHVYRFTAMALTARERAMIHGVDERVPMEKLYTTIRFYVRLMRRC